MTTVALLASQQPAEALTLGTRWAEAGDDVTVVLLDGATAILRPGHPAATLVTTAHDAGVTVWVHDDAVHERGITHDGAVAFVDMDRVAALVGEGATRVQWW
jgi:tetraacyldisaccharide-1-P 4'-kinase